MDWENKRIENSYWMLFVDVTINGYIFGNESWGIHWMWIQVFERMRLIN